MRQFKNVMEALSAIVSAGLLVLQAGQALPVQVSLDREQAAIVFMLKA